MNKNAGKVKPAAKRSYGQRPEQRGKGSPLGADFDPTRPPVRRGENRPHAQGRAVDKSHGNGSSNGNSNGNGHGDGTADKPSAADTEVVCGRNAVMEALKSERSVNKVWLAEGNEAAFSGAVYRLCSQRGIPCHRLPRAKLDALVGVDHRGVAAELAAKQYAEVEDLLAAAKEQGQEPFLIMLDQVEDPHNLGAVIRTALCAGAHGLILPRRRAAAVNQTVLQTSAGAANYLPIARVANLTQTLNQLKAAGCWAVAADMDGETLWSRDLRGPLVLVLGGEGTGVSPLLKKSCDFVVSLPMSGPVSSLNVSNAAAVLMYEILRQRQQ